MSIEVPNLTLRLVKGSPLTAIEGDDNFKTLRNSINALSALFSVSLNDDGTLRNPPVVYGASGTGADAYVINPTPAITALTSLIGRLIVFKADVANTGLATLQINGNPATGILKFKTEALESNDIKAGQFVVLSYDGANFQMQSQPGVVQPANYGQDVGAANAYVINQSGINQIPSALYPGFEISMKAANTNTATSTLKLGALAAVTILNPDTSPIGYGQIRSGQIVAFVYDGANFQLISQTNPKGWAKVLDQRASGVNQEARVDGAWTTKQVQTLENSFGIITSSAGNQFTIRRGVYNVSIHMFFGQCNGRIKLINVTSGATLIYGMNSWAGNAAAGNSGGIGTAMGRISLTADTLCAVQYYTIVSGGGWLGALATGDPEVYTEVLIVEA